MIAEIILITNMYRTLIGLPALIENPILDLTAKTKACDMVNRGYWAHIRPSDGQTPWDILKAHNYKYINAGENLAKDFNAHEKVMTAWLDSPTHRDNIEKKEYTEIGVGTCGKYIVVHFGKPQK